MTNQTSDNTTNEEARECFKESGINFRKLPLYEFYRLIGVIETKLKYHDQEKFPLGLHEDVETKKLDDGTWDAVFLKCNGRYFNGREAISFNPDGFIGFAGWASSSNTAPFINGFLQWMEGVSNDHRN